MVNGRGKMKKKWGFLMKNIVTTYLDKAYNDLKTTLAQNNQSKLSEKNDTKKEVD